MMTPRQPFQRISWLDQFVRRFQDRWETNPQYRSLISGLVGLVLVLTLCTCTSLLTVAGNNVLASVGLTNGNSGINSTTGSTQLQGAQTFPTATFGPFNDQPTPQGAAVASSSTPPPGPTATATQPADNNPTPTSGGGGTNTATFV